MKNSKGFSLVELVVAVAIMSVVGVAVIGFCMAGTNSYQKVGGDADLQYESQLLMNQLEDLLVDTNKGYGYDASAKTLSIYNESDAYKVIWNDTESRVYLEKYGRSANQLYLISTNLMAEYVTGFSVSIPSENESTKQIITIAASMEKGDNSFQSTKSFTLRNELDEFNSMEEAYPDDDIANWTITSVRILDNADNPVSDMSNIGRNQQIQFKSLVNGTNFPADPTEAAALQAVEWSVVSTGNTRKSDDTTVVGGLLTIAEDEPAGALILTATSVYNPNCSASIIISLEEIVRTFDHVDVTHDGTEDKVVTGSTLQFYANVVGENLSTNQKKKVNWSVSAPAGETLSPQTQISADGVLTVATTETASKIIVTAVSYYNADCSGTSQVEVTVPPATVDSIAIRKSGSDIDITDPLYLAKKGTVDLTAVIEGQNLVDLNEYIKTTVTWSVSSSLSSISFGEGANSVNATLTIGEHETATTLTVTATAAADPATPQKIATITVRVENIAGVNVTGPASAGLGQNATFTAALTGGVLPEGVDNSSFNWSVNSASSTITNGVLTVDASETAEQLTVTASYTAANGTTYSGDATINVVAYRSVSIYKEGDTTDYAGGTIPGEYDSTIPLQLSGLVNGSNIEDNTVRWTVSSASGSLDSGTGIDQNGRLVIGASESSEKLIVTATSNKVSTLSSIVYVTVKRPSPVIKIYYNSVDVTGKSVSVTKKSDKDTKVEFTAIVSNAPGATVKWSVSNNSKDDTKINDKGKLTIDKKEKNTLTVTAEITYNGRKYQASVTVNVLEAGVKIDSVGIALGSYYVYDYDIKPGETVVFWAYVDVDSYDAKYQSVTWSIEGNHHADTTLVNGTLYVSPAETNSDFVIRATSTYDATKSGTTNIHVQLPKATAIVVKKGSENVTQKTLDVYQGETLTLTATVSGNNLVTDAQKSVTWACEGNSSVETSISNGVVTISENETAEQLTITATSFDGLVKEYVYLRILKPVVTGVVILQNNAVVSTTTPTVVYAGTETQVQYTARVDGNGLLDKHKNVTWSLKDPSVSKASISADGLLVIAADHPTGELQVCATSVFDTSKTCTITIRIEKVTFDKVTITFENDHRVVTSTDQINAVQGAILDFSAIADGTGLTEEQKKNITWSVSGSDIVSGAPATTIVNGKLSISPGEMENTILTVKAASEDATVFDTVLVKVEKLKIRLYTNTTTPSEGSTGINIAKGSGSVNGYYHVCYDVSAGSYASTCEFSYAMTGNGLSVSENGIIGTDKTVLQIVATKDAGTSGKVSIRVGDYEIASVNVTVKTSNIEKIDDRRYYIFNSATWQEIQYDCMKSYWYEDYWIVGRYQVADSPLFN